VLDWFAPRTTVVAGIADGSDRVGAAQRERRYGLCLGRKHMGGGFVVDDSLVLFAYDIDPKFIV